MSLSPPKYQGFQLFTLSPCWCYRWQGTMKYTTRG